MLEVLRFASDAGHIEARVVEFGKWVRIGSKVDVGFGPNPISTMMKKSASHCGTGVLISDDEAEAIGGAVMALSRARPVLADAIVKYYVERASCNLATLARDLNVSRTKAGELVNAAMEWLQGYFCALLAVACAA